MKLSQGPVRSVIGCSTRPGITSVYTKEQCHIDHEVPRSPNDIFQGMYYPLSWSKMFCNGRAKIGAPIQKWQGPMVEKCCSTNFSITLFLGEEGGGREDEGKRMVKLYLFFLSKLAFLEIR